ncbi:MAG: helix-turn-helix domain-containing protein [Thermoleophilales bacterium]|nr:helix-turn-helix domain-containing protein [Thermoleophilales bacterium]
MKNLRTEIHILEGEERTVEVGEPELCDLIKEARKDRGLTLREVARRSGVSAGQLSRIEGGEVQRPSIATLEAVASALARPAAPLLLFAGHIDRAELDRCLSEVVERLDARGLESVESDFALEASDDEDLAQVVWRMAGQALPAIGVNNESWLEIRDEVEEIAAALTALTPDRRRLVRAFVADQEVLSALDRLPTPRGRYRFAIDWKRARGGPR